MNDTYNTGQVGGFENFSTLGLVGFVLSLVFMFFALGVLFHAIARPNDPIRTMFLFYWKGVTGRRDE